MIIFLSPDKNNIKNTWKFDTGRYLEYLHNIKDYRTVFLRIFVVETNTLLLAFRDMAGGSYNM